MFLEDERAAAGSEAFLVAGEDGIAGVLGVDVADARS